MQSNKLTNRLTKSESNLPLLEEKNEALRRRKSYATQRKSSLSRTSQTDLDVWRKSQLNQTSKGKGANIVGNT